METILTNLLDRDAFSVSGAVVSSGIYEYPATVFCMITQTLPTPTAGHKYYGRVDQKVPAGTTFGDGRFEYFGGDGTGKNIVFASFMSATMDNEWHTYSDILSFPYISGENWTLRSFTVSGSNTVYRRKHMIIDLTEAFGAGNEPTKSWCDENIPYFEGTISITSAASGYVGIGDTAKKLATGYVGVNGVARKIIAGYVGVNGVAKSIWSDEMPDPIDFIEGNYTTYENDLVTEVKQGAFVSKKGSPPLVFFSNLTVLSLPNVKSISSNGLHGLRASVYLPSLEVVGDYALSSYGFGGGYHIYIDWSKIKTIGSSAFSQTNVSIPDIFENLETIGSDAFYRSDVSFPTKNSLTFYKLKSIYKDSFKYSTLSGDGTMTVKTLSILSDSVCTVYGNDSYGPFNFSEDSKIIVPASLVDAYKSDTFWSTYANLIEGV